MRFSVCAWLGTEVAWAVNRLGGAHSAGSREGLASIGHGLRLASPDMNLVSTATLALVVVLIAAIGNSHFTVALGGMLLALLAGATSDTSFLAGLGEDQLENGVPVSVRVVDCGVWRKTEFSIVSSCSMHSFRWQGKVVPTKVSVRVSLPKTMVEGPGCARLRGILRRFRPPRNKLYGMPSPRRLTLATKSERLIQPEACGQPQELWKVGTEIVRAKIASVLLAPKNLGGSGLGEPAFGRQLAAAMWLGEPGLVAARVRVGFGNWGLAHLLAVSGLHIGILLGLGLMALSVPAARFPAICMGAQCLWLLGCGILVLMAVGPRVSVTRSLVMATIAMLALWRKRPSGSLATLAAALGALVLFSPLVLQGQGFRLSFAATLGVVLGSPRLTNAWNKLPRLVAAPLAVSVSAQLATLPWALTIYPVVPLAAPLANLFAVPVAMATLVLSLLVVSAELCGAQDLWALEVALRACGRFFLSMAETDVSPWLQAPWPWHPMAAVAWAVICAVMIVRPARRWPLALPLAAALWWPPENVEKVSFLDVGQGDSILLRSGAKNLLVDGGGWRGAQVGSRVLMPVLAKERVRTLHAVVLTHGDFDHCRGLLEITWMLKVEELWLAPGVQSGRCVEDLMARFPASTHRIRTGDIRAVGGWNVEVVADGTGARTANGRSLVLVAEQSAHAIVLTGDMEAEDENSLLRTANVASRLSMRMRTMDEVLLKVAHHGSRTSTSERFLDAVRPTIAVISAGARNPYGHPSRVVLRRLEERKIQVLRTDKRGRIDYCLGNGCEDEYSRPD